MSQSVHVRIKDRNGDASEGRLRLFEFQGSFEYGAYNKIGAVDFSDEKAPVMSIGNVRVVGRMEKIEKPVLVLRKEEGGRLVLFGKIYEKVVFDKRPVFVLRG